jgi:hypothetical protein
VVIAPVATVIPFVALTALVKSVATLLPRPLTPEEIGTVMVQVVPRTQLTPFTVVPLLTSAAFGTLPFGKVIVPVNVGLFKTNAAICVAVHL